MGLFIKNNTWRHVVIPFMRVSDTWREVKELYIKVSGTYRLVYPLIGDSSFGGLYIGDYDGRK